MQAASRRRCPQLWLAAGSITASLYMEVQAAPLQGLLQRSQAHVPGILASATNYLQKHPPPWPLGMSEAVKTGTELPKMELIPLYHVFQLWEKAQGSRGEPRAEFTVALMAYAAKCIMSQRPFEQGPGFSRHSPVSSVRSIPSVGFCSCPC